MTDEEFIRRFLQHVLPKGFVKVRAYGLLAAGNRALLRQAQTLLGLTTSPPPADKLPEAASPAPSPALACPKCGQPMLVIQRLPKRSRSPP